MTVPDPTGDPYPGLRSFQRKEYHIFFGRDSTIHEMVDRLAAHRFLAVTGTSGSGKSSLVRTGLLNALHLELMGQAGTGGWKVVDFRPGGRPLTALAEALIETLGEGSSEYERAVVEAKLSRSPKGLLAWLEEVKFPPKANLLLLVDQFEEIFRFRHGLMGDDIDAFVALLLASAKQRERNIYVVITMRSDFLGDCAQFTGLAETINDGQFLTPRLTREQCQEAIEGPAGVYGGRVEPALTNRLLNDMGTNPDQLPLMQHALMLLWEEAKKRAGTGAPILTLKDYERVGGIGGGIGNDGDANAAAKENSESALSRHASKVLSGLDKSQQRFAEIMFRALTESGGTAGRDVRRPIELGEVADIAGVPWQNFVPVVEAFRAPGRNFLRPPLPVVLEPKTTLDITHESLIRQWSKLREWVRAEFQSAETYRHIERTARLWDKGQAGLLTMPFLGVAQAWRDREQPNATWAARYHDSVADQPNLAEVDSEKYKLLAKERFDLAMAFLDKSQEEQQRAEAKRKSEDEEALRQEIRAETAERRARNARFAFAAAFVGLAVMVALSGLAIKERNSANTNLDSLIKVFGKNLEIVRAGYLSRDIREDRLLEFLQTTEGGFQLLQANVNAQHIQAQILDAYSEAFNARGSVKVALRCGEEEFQKASDLVRSSQITDEWRHDLARSYWRIGEARLALGDLTEQSSRLNESKAAQACSVAALQKNDKKDLVDSIPGAPRHAWGAFKGFLQQMRELKDQNNKDYGKWQRDLSKAYERIGDVLLPQNKLKGEEGALDTNLDKAGAFEAYDKKRKIAENNEEIAKSNSQGNNDSNYWKWDRVVSHLSLADVQFALGELDERKGALHHAEEAKKLAGELVDADSSFARWRWNLGLSHKKIGEVWMANSDPGKARTQFDDYLIIIDRLITQDPSSRTWKRHKAIAQEKIGDVFMAQGKAQEAREKYEEDNKIAADLFKDDRLNTDFKRDLAISEEKVGDVLMVLAKPEEALLRYERYRGLAAELVGEDGQNADWQRDQAISYHRIGETFRKLGKRQEAAEAFKQCWQALVVYKKPIKRYDPRNGRPENVEEDCRKQEKQLAN